MATLPSSEDDDVAQQSGMISTITINGSSKKPNKELTLAERQEKSRLKKELKASKRKRRLQTKLNHAIRIGQQQEEAWQQHRTKKNGEINGQKASLEKESPIKEEEADDELQQTKAFVLQIYSALKRSLGSSTKDEKQSQISASKFLLSHMNKATQQLTMFQSKAALLGYLRQKFQQRALLVYTSLIKLQPTSDSNNINSKYEDLWHLLTSMEHVVSVACGPGGDLVGFMAFCKLHAKKPLQQAVLADYAMTDWNTILEPLIDILLKHQTINFLKLACDITKPLLNHESNHEFLTCTPTANNNNNNKAVMYLFSYILTETRDKWQPFLKQLVATSAPGSVFLFAEPTPWQLHVLIAELSQGTSSSIQFLWLDCTFQEPPERQQLDGRMGPAVLLGWKP